MIFYILIGYWYLYPPRAEATRLGIRFPFAAGFSLRMDAQCHLPE